MMRWLHKIYAQLFGYDWHTCPICGKHFGGHEIKGRIKQIVLRQGIFLNVCPRDVCYSKAISENIQRWYQKSKREKSWQQTPKISATK